MTPYNDVVGHQHSTPWVKQPGLEADQSLPSSAEVKNMLTYTSTPTIRFHG